MSFRRALALIVGAGLLIRLGVVFTADGIFFDLHSYRRVLDSLKVGGLSVYELIEPRNWPYGPGYFPWVLAAGKLGQHMPFDQAIRLGAVLADAGIALLVQDLLRRGGAGRRRRLQGAAIVSLGPIFIGVSGHNGQVDPAATLAALGAYWVWTRPGQRRRAVWAGVLLGAGAAIKTVPLLLTLPFAASARSRREGAGVVAVTTGFLFLALLPFYLRTPEEVLLISQYHGLPGLGGLGLLAEPGFSAAVLAGEPVAPTDTLLTLATTATGLILTPALLALGALLIWKRPDLLTGICLTWLVVYVFGVNFLVGYLVWLLPFLVVRGHFGAAVGLQLALTPAMLAIFNAPVDRAVAVVAYTGAMGLAWMVAAGVLGGWVTRLARTA